VDLGLSGRVYITTGSTSGLGEACATQLLAEGAKVIISSRDQTRVDAAVAKFDVEHPGQVIGVAADLAESDSASRLIAAAMDEWGSVDGLILSGGGPPSGGVLSADDSQWAAAFESVFLGPLRLAREAAGVMKSGSCIGIVLSGSVYSPIPGIALSNGFRPGLAMALKTLSDELSGTGVRTVGLVPGRIETTRTLELDAANPEVSRKRNAAIPAGRLGTTEEFAKVATFMVSPAASYVNGTNIVIDGGSKRAL